MKTLVPIFCLLMIACAGGYAGDDKQSPCNHSPLENFGQVFYDEIVINKPVKDVWPEILNYPEWQVGHTDAEHTTVKGEHNKVGEIVRILKTHKGAEPYFAETVRLVPFEHVVWRVFTDKRSSCADAFGTSAFLDFRTEEVNGKTRFTTNYYASWPIFGEDLQKLRDTQLDGVEGVDFLKQGGVAFKKYMENL